MKEAASMHNTVDRAWHELLTHEALHLLETGEREGLSQQAAAERLHRHGENALPERAGRSLVAMLLGQFADFMIVVLLAAALISGWLGEIKDALAIVVIVLLNAVIGFIQEYRAEQAMAALRKLAAVSARVLRDGAPEMLPAHLLVPGDIVMLEAGNVVPADMRLLQVASFRVDESALTGESSTVEKHVHRLAGSLLPLGDRLNMVYKGTIASHGRALGVVVATGSATELGKIAVTLQDAPDVRTPLQKRLAAFGKRLALLVLAICIIVFIAGIMRGVPPVLMFMTAVSLAVAAIPEALPAVVTIALALGARKMVQRNALIRRLPAVETLGSVTCICTDKTGTLTQNRMHVDAMFYDGRLQEAWFARQADELGDLLFRALALSNDAVSGRHGKITGDPTEVALYQAASKAGYVKEVLELDAPRLLEIPFDSERKRMTTFHRHGDAIVSFTKGAPESVLPNCTRLMTADGLVSLQKHELMQQATRMAEAGMRVLAISCRKWAALPARVDTGRMEKELVFLGLAGLLDPPRHETHEAVSLCRSAGIRPVMITGDHPATARAIAARLDMLAEGDRVMTGTELAAMDQHEFEEQVLDIRIYARMDPQQKIRIVRALQGRGEIVAMTGDGVNDAPALKHADIGVAMGKGGTDVAREAADLVLLDDNFASIVSAVSEGRRIYDNIRKFIKYVMTGNAGEIWTIFLAPLLGLPIPLLPIHILWVNLVTDGLPGLALTGEPAAQDIMRRKPRPPAESILAHGMWQHILWMGLLLGGISLFTQVLAIETGMHWQTMVFTVLCLAQMGHVLAIRSERESLFRLGVRSNSLLLVAVLLTFAMQLAIIYTPLLQEVFRTEALSFGELVICLLLSSVVFWAVELEKLLVRKGWLYRHDG